MIHKVNALFQKKHLLIVVLVFIIAIVFETFQQLYYMKRFNLADDVTFFSILKTQSFKWIVWVVVSTLLVWYVKVNSSKKEKQLLDYVKYSLVIFGLVFLSIIIISIIQLSLSDETFSLSLLFGEYVTFFSFQKAPIYTLGYIAIGIILHLYFSNRVLNFQVQQLSEIKAINKELYNKLKSYNDDKATVLNIKIGNKRKIITIQDINWIEADDYCVKVHTANATYTMRSSLKTLQEKLGPQFLRVHRKALVNIDMIKELHLSNSPNLILNNDIVVPVSKSKLKFVRDFLS